MFFVCGSIVVLLVGIVWALSRTPRVTPTPYSGIPSQTAEVDGFAIHYKEAGEGAALVLLHGIGGSLYTWRYLIPLASRFFRVIALDLPGFGESAKIKHANYGLDAQAERVCLFLAQLGVQEATLMGSSMGGAIALWMAKLHPERFSRVVGLAPATYPRFKLLNLSLLRHISVQAHRGMNRIVMRQILRLVVSRPERIADDTVHFYLQPYLSRDDGIHTFLLATRILQDARLPRELHSVRSRVLLLYGACDRLIDLKMMTSLQGILPDAQLVVHPTAGHHSMEDEPDWVMAQTLEFLRS